MREGHTYLEVINVTWWERCAQARRAAGIRQRDIAMQTGYTISNISQFERGHSNNALLLLVYMTMMTADDIADMVRAEVTPDDH